MLMDARDEEAAPMSAKQLRDEMATLLTAGHETTTLVLAWALFLIGSNSEVAERMAAELNFLNGRARPMKTCPVCDIRATWRRKPCGFIRRSGCSHVPPSLTTKWVDSKFPPVRDSDLSVCYPSPSQMVE